MAAKTFWSRWFSASVRIGDLLGAPLLGQLLGNLPAGGVDAGLLPSGARRASMISVGGRLMLSLMLFSMSDDILSTGRGS